MPWFLAVLFVGSIVASLLLMPKPKIENARASTFDDLNFPRAKEGEPYPIGAGRFRARGPNTLWAGDWEAVPIKKKQKTGLFSSKKVIVGYRYFVGLALAIVLGPGCKMLKIWYGKDLLWEGEVSADGTAININKPDLFGGKEKGGGFVGTIRFYSGSWTQTPNAYLESQLGVGDVTAYRGQCYVVFEHCEIGEQNTLRDLSFEMSRYTNTLGLPDNQHIIQEDANPFELLYNLYASDWGGLNVPTSMLNDEVFQECAATVFTEQNGMSLFISKSNDGSDLSQEVLRQVDGLLYQDPPTGKIVPVLIRNDYDIEDLPVFDESNTVAVRKFTAKLWEDTINQMRVTFTSRERKYETGSAFEQDLANISAQGRVRGTTQNYPGITRGDLAGEVCRRDLAQVSVPTISANLETNREAQKLRPGSVFVWSWDEYGIEQTVMRVKNFDLGALVDNRIVLDVSQDQFALDQTVFAPPGAGGSNATQPDDPAIAPTEMLIVESPYYIASASGIVLAANKGILLVSSEQTANALTYDVYTSTDFTNYNQSEEGVVFTPQGALVGSIDADTSLTTGTLTSITATMEVDDLEQYSAGEVANGNGLLMLNNEIMAYETFTDNMDGTVTFNNVWRGLLDTGPQAHAAGDQLFLLEGNNVVDDQFDSDDQVRVKIVVRTFNNVADLGATDYDSVTLNHRADRPLVPAAIAFDGGTLFNAPADPSGSKTLTWANRDRLSDTVRKISDTTSENESGQQTVFRYRVNAGAWTTNLLAPGVTSFEFDAGAGALDTVDYELYSTRNGYDSYSKWTFSSGAGAGTVENPALGGGDPADDNDPYTVGGGVTLWRVNATGTGASQDITLPYGDVDENGVLVFVNGIKYETGEYGISGTTLTVQSNAIGDSIEIIGITE